MAEPIRTTATIRPVDDEAAAPLYVTEQRPQDNLVVVTVHGEIDLSNISILRNELAGYDEEPWLIIDMSSIRFCGVVGARLLHTMAVQSSTAGRRFEVVTNPMMARMLVLTRLADGITYRVSRDVERL